MPADTPASRSSTEALQRRAALLRELASLADHLADATDEVRRRADATTWSGPIADEFRERAAAQARSLDDLAASLRAAARRLDAVAAVPVVG